MDLTDIARHQRVNLESYFMGFTPNKLGGTANTEDVGRAIADLVKG